MLITPKYEKIVNVYDTSYFQTYQIHYEVVSMESILQKRHENFLILFSQKMKEYLRYSLLLLCDT